MPLTKWPPALLAEYDALVAYAAPDAPARQLADFLDPGVLGDMLSRVTESEQPRANALYRAVELAPGSSVAYAQLGAWADNHPVIRRTTVAACYARAIALSPRASGQAYENLRFQLSNAYSSELDELHKGRTDLRASEATLREVRRAWATEMRALIALKAGRWNAGVWNGLGTVLNLQGKEAEAEHAYRQAARLLDFGPLTQILQREADARRAARGRKPARRPGQDQSHLRTLDAYRDGRVSADDKRDVQTALQGLHDLLLAAKASKPAQVAMLRELRTLGITLGIWPYDEQRPKTHFEGLLACPWHEPSAYGELTVHLEADAAAIGLEMMALLRKRAAGDAEEHIAWYIDHERIARKPSRWLRRHVDCRDGVAVAAPRTCAAINRGLRWYYAAPNRGSLVHLPEVFYQKAQFSILLPGAHVRPHTGPTNERLVISLGLVGTDTATLRVGNRTRSWRRGEALMFDDSFEHEVVVPPKSRARAVVIVHFKHHGKMPQNTNGASIAAAGGAVCDASGPTGADDGNEAAGIPEADGRRAAGAASASPRAAAVPVVSAVVEPQGGTHAAESN